MKVSDFENQYDVNTIAELRAVLAKRYPVDGHQANSFWLAHAAPFPLMSILVKDDVASVWYSENENNPGSNSTGTLSDMPRGENSAFYLNGERQWMPNESVISVSEAVQAAEEFFTAGTRPKSIAWLDLRLR
jgi:hypothetical protein